MEELILPAGYPMSLLRLRALAHLTAKADREMWRQTRFAVAAIAVQAGTLLIGLALRVSGQAPVVAAGTDLIVLVGLGVGLGLSVITVRQRRRLVQAELARALAGIQDRSVCPLEILKARFEPSGARPTTPGTDAQAEAALLESFQRAAAVKRAPHDSLTG